MFFIESCAARIQLFDEVFAPLLLKLVPLNACLDLTGVGLARVGGVDSHGRGVPSCLPPHLGGHRIRRWRDTGHALAEFGARFRVGSERGSDGAGLSALFVLPCRAALGT